MVMRTGVSDTLPRGHRGRIRQDARLKKARKSRHYRIDLEGLESRTLLATIPAAAATGPPIPLTFLGTTTDNGNANSPTVAIDPYHSQKLFAVWGRDLSTLNPVPHTTAIIEGAYSDDGGASWIDLGQSVSFPILDAATVNSTPPTAYTQVTDPTVAFDGQGNVYVLARQATGATDGALTLTKFNFAGNAPQFNFENTVYQWLPASDGAFSPTLAVDSSLSSPPAGVPPDPHANNLYIAWASNDHAVANPNVYGTNFNPNRAELMVSSDGGQSFSGIVTANIGGNFGPQQDTHPQLAINQNNSGQITVAWDDSGSGSKATPAFDFLMSNTVPAGDSYQFVGSTGPINPGLAGTPNDIPVTTPFTTTVNVPNPAAVTDLTVTVALTHPADTNLSLVLQAPNNGPSITLVLNQINAAGVTNTGQGISGADLGVFGHDNTHFGLNIGTVFDDNATRDIFDSTTGGTNGNTAPYIGHFRPEDFQSLNTFVQQVAAAGTSTACGPWRSRIFVPRPPSATSGISASSSPRG